MRSWKRVAVTVTMAVAVLTGGLGVGSAASAAPVAAIPATVTVSPAQVTVPVSSAETTGVAAGAPAGSTASGYLPKPSKILKLLGKYGPKALQKAREGYSSFKSWWGTVPSWVRKPVEWAIGGATWEVFDFIVRHLL